MKFDIAKMLKTAVYDHPVGQLQLIETHSSWVVLTGDFAYKIKKPVDFGFLDFSTLAKRRTACMQELQLNRRMAAELYLQVVPIASADNRLVISGEGPALEYAVKMRQFPQSAQLDNMLAAGQLGPQQLEAIARMITQFHQGLVGVEAESRYGSAAHVYRSVEENFGQIEAQLSSQQHLAELQAVRQWTDAQFESLAATLQQRKLSGFVRECHGDLHLRNLVWLQQKPLAFDCIEFNADLRWIDVISDIAFLVMDLHSRGQAHLANRFLNSYLEATGDYAGLAVLPFYLCYRALVRAKVDALRLSQENITAAEITQSRREFESYLALASSYTERAEPRLIIMRGLSASGKSTVSSELLSRLAVIRLRSDVERKRLFEIDSEKHTSEGIDEGIYAPAATQQTYARLLELAAAVLDCGYSVLVDAAFLHYQQRRPFQLLAAARQIPYVILETSAADDVLRTRIKQRQDDVSDADLAVLEYQLNNRQPLHKHELATLLEVNTAQLLAAADIDDLAKRVRTMTRRE